MRLNVKYKQSLTKTEKQKKANKEKKAKGPKIRKDYNDTTEYKHDNIEMDLTKLSYGIIDSCDVDALLLPDGTIRISNSWLEVLLIMLDAVIENHPDDFVKLFEENAVTNQFFCVDKVYGKYTFEKEQYKAYKIFHSGYYLEAILNNANIFSAILGLTKCLEISLDEIKFHLRNKKYKDITLNFDMLEETESIVDINGLASMLKDGIHLVAIDILGVSTSVHRIDVVLMVFCNWAYENYGIGKVKSLGKHGNTGISLGDNTEDIPSTQIKNSELHVYTDGDQNDIIQFIKNSMNKLEIGTDKIRFKFRALKKKGELKEWELN